MFLGWASRQGKKDIKLERQATSGYLNATDTIVLKQNYEVVMREDPNSRIPTLLTKVDIPSTMAFSHPLQDIYLCIYLFTYYVINYRRAQTLSPLFEITPLVPSTGAGTKEAAVNKLVETMSGKQIGIFLSLPSPYQFLPAGNIIGKSI